MVGLASLLNPRVRRTLLLAKSVNRALDWRLASARRSSTFQLNTMLEWLRRLVVPRDSRLGTRGTSGTAVDRISQTLPRPRVAPIRREKPWDPTAVELYDSLIRIRMAEHACPTCGTTLENGSLVARGGGAVLEGFGLSDGAAARLIACTERLSIRCSHCGTQSII